jgi:hypothetical protein
MNDKQEFPFYQVRIELSAQEIERYRAQFRELTGKHREHLHPTEFAEANELIARIKAKL